MVTVSHSFPFFLFGGDNSARVGLKTQNESPNVSGCLKTAEIEFYQLTPNN